ncbi:MAG: hypothetical protein KC503_39810 [Myxococcales bacterium]|nr:hypothetical protein [Myxococcales bacterium]
MRRIKQSTLLAALLAALLGALAGCDDPLTQLLVYIDADSTARARGRRVRVVVSGESGLPLLDKDVAIGSDASFPLRVPLLPMGGDAARRWSVYAELIDEAGQIIAQKRAIGSYLAEQVSEVWLLFESACLDTLDCGGRTCQEGTCVSACVVPGALGSGARARPVPCPDIDCAGGCGECEVCVGGSCQAVGDGTPCGDGRCWRGACCDGCWDGTKCVAGDSTEACGGDGRRCEACTCTGDSCSGGFCEQSTQARRVAAGALHTCALLGPGGAGEAYCWGEGRDGALGVGPDAPPKAELPQRIVKGSPELYVEIGTGARFSCALDSAGVISCWGRNDVGQLGAGVPGDLDTPLPIAGTWRSLGVGGAHACAVSNDGSGAISCWGGLTGWETGQGARAPAQLAPAAVASSVMFGSVSAGVYHSCAVDDGRGLWCWGDVASFALGQVAPAAPLAQPTRVGSASDWSRVVAGAFHNCALRGAGELWCWGENSHGQVGVGPARPGVLVWQPRRVGSNDDYNALALGQSATCAVRRSGELYCWGSNDIGQLGLGDRLDRDSPARVSLEGWQAIALGRRHTCGVRRGGTLWCWGENTRGQLGLGAGQGLKQLPTRVCFPAP